MPWYWILLIAWLSFLAGALLMGRLLSRAERHWFDDWWLNR